MDFRGKWTKRPSPTDPVLPKTFVPFGPLMRTSNSPSFFTWDKSQTNHDRKLPNIPWFKPGPLTLIKSTFHKGSKVITFLERYVCDSLLIVNKSTFLYFSF